MSIGIWDRGAQPGVGSSENTEGGEHGSPRLSSDLYVCGGRHALCPFPNRGREEGQRGQTVTIVMTGTESSMMFCLHSFPLGTGGPNLFTVLLGRNPNIRPLPEKCVMLHTHFPEALGGPVVRQFEPNGALKLFKLKYLKHTHIRRKD